LKANNSLKPNYKNLFFSYRGYGYLYMYQFDVLFRRKSLQDFSNASNNKRVDSATQFNVLLAKSLKYLYKKEYSKSIEFAISAHECIPSNKTPQSYQILASIFKALDENSGNVEGLSSYIHPIIQELSLLIESTPTEHSFLFLRGILNLYQKEFMIALEDMEKAIKNNDETNLEYHYIRGLCYSCLSLFNEAIGDFSLIIKKDENNTLAYLNRGKCAYLVGDSSMAFNDFQMITSLNPKSSRMFLNSGNFLMTNGAYEDALKSFTEAYELSDRKNPLALYQRSRCYIALSQLMKSYEDLKIVAQLVPEDKIVESDLLILESIVKGSMGKEIKDFQIPIELLNKALKIDTCEENHDPKDKTYVADYQEVKSTYRENIFSKEDIFLYRAVFHFYAKDYDKSISVFLNRIIMKV